MSDVLQEAIDMLSELKRMHQLNLELLEQLNVACGWILDKQIPIQNSEHIASLLVKAKALVTEIQSREPKVLQYQKLADEKKQQYRTDEEGTVPYFSEFYIHFQNPHGFVFLV